jgi:phosphoribosylformylglycinamidine synthase II/phosphoribosylformylglycinamidine synthase I
VHRRNLIQEVQVSTKDAVQPTSTFRVEVATGTEEPGYRLYFLEGALSAEAVTQLSQQLLADPVTETFAVRQVSDFIPLNPTEKSKSEKNHSIEVTLLPGVTDPAAENLLRAAKLLGITGLERVATGQRHIVDGIYSEAELEALATSRFSNPVIQRFTIDQPITPPFVPFQAADATVEIVALRDADDEALMRISGERRLALNLAEMQAVRDYFRQESREPTDAEIEMIAQTWSEHCVHKTFKAKIEFTNHADGTTRTIDGLLKTYIRAATDQIAKPWVHSAFVDNAGIIAFDDEWDLAFKVETHNHPSALEPFGGANTGVGGVVRDVLGVSARPIANTDVLCFGMPDTDDAALPEGTLHPRRIAEGVIYGVEDYGNKMGIPTVNGAVLYHPGYTANPLVFCGCLGLLPRGSHVTGARDGDLIVVIGGRTGRDGLRGATFSSMEMDTQTTIVAGSAVQIGHPIHEKQVQEVILRLRDAKLYHAITDCGAGGLSSAVGEMAAELGARVQLTTVPLKYPGLRPWEIWLSEAQERMVLAIAPEDWNAVAAICAGQDVEAANIGIFEATGKLLLKYDEHFVGDLSVDFLHDGIPQLQLKAEWDVPEIEAQSEPTFDMHETLLKLLAHPDIRSKESVVRRYDHEVQGGTAIKPLVGAEEHGHGDAAVLVPLDSQRSEQGRTGAIRGVALSTGIAPRYGELDPYTMAWAVVDEAFRNLVSVGANPDQVALLDNFCWGSPYLADRLGGLVRCAEGCHDAAIAYGAPFISGKDSLNNEYTNVDGTRHAIPGTLLISAVGIVPDVEKTVTSDLKQVGDFLYVVGATHDEFGGGHLHLINGMSGGTVPQPVPDGLQTMRALHKAISAGLVHACHDCSEGGIAVALAEMCIGGKLGATLVLSDGFEPKLLFSESQGRFIVEVSVDNHEAFEQAFPGIELLRFGLVRPNGKLTVRSQSSVTAWQVADLEQAWRGNDEAQSTDVPPEILAHAPITRTPMVRIVAPRVLILHANGTNRDRDAALACELAGGEPEIVHVNQLASGEKRLLDYQMLVVPGGFSYGDDLGAGTLWALDLQQRFETDVKRFVSEGRPVLGICNGFQALVKSGLLPGEHAERKVTLTYNASGHFECRWVYLQANAASPCLFTEGLDEPIYCPVAHGEGRLAVADTETLQALWIDGLVALTYSDADGNAAAYPANPNGSVYGIAGLCNRAGNVLGLMPHPEDHVFGWQHPRREQAMDGLRLFKNGIRYA